MVVMVVSLCRWPHRRNMTNIVLLIMIMTLLFSFNYIPSRYGGQTTIRRTNSFDVGTDFFSNVKTNVNSGCSVQFQDESTLLCYFSEPNMTTNTSKGLSLLRYMLHYYFPNCSSSFIRTKDMSHLPELRFNRRCFFVFDDINNIHSNNANSEYTHIRPGDIYWGYQREDISLLFNDTVQAFFVPNYMENKPYKSSSAFSASDNPMNWIDSFPHHLFRTVFYENTTAVIVLGNLRGGESTWHTLYRHVLDVNHADLILVLVGDVPPPSLQGNVSSSSSMLSRAKFVFQIPHFNDWAAVLEIMAKEGNNTAWRRIVPEIIGNASILLGASSIGEEDEGKIRAGSGALLFSARWILREIIKENHFASIYDRFILTRSDQYYLCDNDISTLQPPTKIFIPNGEDYGGICDRHLICSSSDVLSILNVLPPLIQHPERYTQYQSDLFLNTERFFKLRLSEMNLFNNVERYPRRMFIAGVDGDGFTWRSLSTNILPEGVYFKYQAEYIRGKAVCFEYVKQNVTSHDVSSFNQSSPIGLAIWDGTQVHGWACDLDNPLAHIDIRIIIHNHNNSSMRMLSNDVHNTTTQNVLERREREILVKANKNSGTPLRYICNGGVHHSFSKKISPLVESDETLRIDNSTQLQVFAIDPMEPSVQVKLLDTPYIFVPNSQHLPIGDVSWDGQQLSGWACDKDLPKTSLEIQIQLSDDAETNTTLQEEAQAVLESSSTAKSTPQHSKYPYVTTILADQPSGRRIKTSCDGGFQHKFSWIMPGDFHLQSEGHSFVKLQVFALDPMDPQNIKVEIFNTSLSLG